MRLIRPTQRGNTHMCCGMMYTIKSRKTANLRGGVFAKIPQDLDEHPSAWLVNMCLSWIRTTPVHKCLVQSNLSTLFALNHARMHNKAKHFFGLLKSNLLSDPGWCCTTENLQTQWTVFLGKYFVLVKISCNWCDFDVLLLKCDNKHFKRSLLFPSSQLQLGLRTKSTVVFSYSLFTLSVLFGFISNPFYPILSSLPHHCPIILFLPLAVLIKL